MAEKIVEIDFRKSVEDLMQKGLRGELNKDEMNSILTTLADIQRLFEVSVAQAENGNLVVARQSSFTAGMLYGIIIWQHLDPLGAIAVAQNLLERLHKQRDDNTGEADKNKQRAISELQRRHEAAPKTTKTSHLRSMAKVDKGAEWGSYRALVRYCKEIKFGKDGK